MGHRLQAFRVERGQEFEGTRRKKCLVFSQEKLLMMRHVEIRKIGVRPSRMISCASASRVLWRVPEDTCPPHTTLRFNHIHLPYWACSFYCRVFLTCPPNLVGSRGVGVYDSVREGGEGGSQPRHAGELFRVLPCLRRKVSVLENAAVSVSPRSGSNEEPLYTTWRPEPPRACIMRRIQDKRITTSLHMRTLV